MSYGFRIVRSDGTEIVGPGIPGGGLFIGARYVTAGSSQTWTFPKVPSGDYLRILQNLGGNHLWNVGTIGGQATLTATAQPTYGTSGLDDSQFLVFSTYTVEDLSESYGLAVINDIGERLVSANFHLPQFLGKLGNGSWTLSGSSLTPSGYTKYRYSQSTGLGSGRNVLVLWNIPNSTDDVWYYVPYSYFTASGSYNVEVFVYANSAIHTLPEAFVFAVDGHTASADTYGIRCYNSSGQILFDSGLNHMTVDVISSGLAYPARDSTTSAAGMFSDTIPLFFIPRYTENEISPTAPLALNSYDKWWFAAVKRTGSTLHSQLIQDSETTEDIYVPSTQSFYLGQSAGLTVLSVKGSTYGATSIGSSSPTILMSPSTLPSGTVGTAYSQTITASGGTGPYTFSTVNGSLPAGLSLASNGALTGTPTTVGSNSFKIRATDANTYATSTNYAILIQSGLLTSPFVSNFSATYNPVFESGTSTTTLSFDLTDNTASGAPRTVYWKVVGGSGTTAGDFTGTIQSSVASINGTITRSVPVTVYADNTTEGTENFHLELFMNAGYTGSAFYTSTNVTIVDNSLTPSPSPIYIPPSGTQNYDLTAPASVTEGNIITFTLNTQNVEEGTLIPYTITGIQSDDIVGSPSLSGNWYVGLPSQPRYTNYGQLGHWNIVIDPAPGLAGAFFKKGLEVMVSEEPYWNNVYGITGTALSDAITAAHSAGLRAGINLTPYAESGDGVNAGTATRQDLKDLINNYDVDFVAMDPYWFVTNGMNMWTTGDLTSWTDDIIATALAKGCYVKLVVQGFYDTGTLTATTAYRNSQLARSNIEEFINYDTPGPWSTIPNAAFSDQTASTSKSFTMATGGSAENETMTMSISVASIVVDTVNVTVVDSTPTPVAPSPTPAAPSPTPAAPSPTPEAPSPTPEAPSPTPSGESYLFILPGFGATVNEGSSITFTVEGSSVPLGTVRYWRVFSASDPLADASDVTALTGSVTLNVNDSPNVNGSFTVTAATDANAPETGEGFFARLYLTSGDRDSDVDGSLAIASSQNVTIINTTPSPVPAAPSPTPAAPSPTPEAPSPTPEAPSPTPEAPSPTPEAPSPTPAAPSPTPAAPSPVPAAPSPVPAAPTYMFTQPGSGTSANEGSSVTFTVEASGVSLGTVSYWRAFSSSIPAAEPADLQGSIIQGSVTLNVLDTPYVNGSFNITIATDTNWPETGENFFVKLYANTTDRNNDTNILATSEAVTIVNTSPAPSPVPAAPSPVPAAPSPTPEAPSPTPAAPSPTPAAPSPTPEAPSPTPTAPSYNEVLFISGPGYSYYDGNYWVCENTGQAWYIEISGGMPNDSFTSNAGNSSLDGSGAFISGDLYGAVGVGGTFNLTVNFAGTGHTRTMTIKGDSC